MFEHLDIWRFLAGIGIFMFGIFLLEEALKQLSGRTFKRFIKKTTTGRIKSVASGIFSTAILQSSSAVSLTTLALVGAGLISMQNAIGVILGTNIGTTFTGWIVAFFGFKLNIESFFLPLIGLGGLGLIFLNNSQRYSGISKLFVAMGFLFMGINYMKQSVEEYAASIDIAALPHYGIWLYVVMGFFLTALMQSSSATLALILTLLNSKILLFNEGAAMVIGSNVGTTITLLIGVIGAVQIKKQVAYSHIIFNVVTAIIAFLLLPVFIYVYNHIDAIDNNHVLGIALFHTCFNLTGVICFLPFTSQFAKLLEWMFPQKITSNTIYINNVSPDLTEAAIKAMKEEIKHLLIEAVNLGAMLLGAEEKHKSASSHFIPTELLGFSTGKTPELQLAKITELEKSITLYAANIRHTELEETDAAHLYQLMHASMSINQVVKILWGLREYIEVIENTENNKVIELYELLKTYHINYWHAIEKEIVHTEIKDEIAISAESRYNIILENYETFVSTVAKKLEEGSLKEKHVSSLLQLNGLLTQSNRQLHNSSDVLIKKAVEQEG
jgi:phosphate:Na+ symporter